MSSSLSTILIPPIPIAILNASFGCFITHSITENKPITNVIYDDDGDWLCFHAYTIKEDDAYIVSIEQIIEHDKTLLSLPDLREGEKVRRSNINELWEKY